MLVLINLRQETGKKVEDFHTVKILRLDDWFA